MVGLNFRAGAVARRFSAGEPPWVSMFATPNTESHYGALWGGDPGARPPPLRGVGKTRFLMVGLDFRGHET
eukprot:12894013-Alexandrium_andersonii.AAC.1